MKKLLSVLTATAIAGGLLTGCGNGNGSTSTSSQGPSKASDVTLTFMSNMTGASSDALAQVCKDFTAKTGIKIDYSAPSNDYESLMKTKMASGDLPDLWTTHGWSVARYSPFLRSLNDQSWASNISSLIKPQIADKNGNIYVLPVDQDVAGIVYNADVLKQCNINVDTLTTWDAFNAACKAIAAKGIVPVAMGNKDTWTIGQFFDWVAPSIYITDDKNNQRSQFLDGSFDWNKWSTILTMLQTWQKENYLNKDVLTSDYNTITAQLGQGKVAFEFFGNYAIADAAKANTNANIGFMPVPAYDSGDTPTLISGEHLAVGVWKDSKHSTEALQFLNYLATPDVMSKLATTNGMLPGLKGVTANLGTTQQYYDKYANTRTFPYFDRAYLPSGMWDDMCLTGANVLSGKPIADQIPYMSNSYKTKLTQAK